MNKEVKQALNSTLTRVHTSLMARSLRGMYVCYGQSVTIASDLHIWTGGVGVVLREQIFYDGKFWRGGVGGLLASFASSPIANPAAVRA